MNNCNKCGVSGEKLFDVVLEEGIVNLCLKCSAKGGVILRKPLGLVDEHNSKKSVYERVASVAGINLNTHKSFDKRVVSEQDKMLKDLVENNFKNNSIKTLDESYLIRNFHWIIMRARRLRKLSHTQLAREMSESEELLKMVENGIVPEEKIDIINKLEIYFGINLFTPKVKEEIENKIEKKIAFDPITTRLLTIEDLKEMKTKQESEILGNCNYNQKYIIEKDEPEKSIFEKEEFSKEDIDNIIFGRR